MGLKMQVQAPITVILATVVAMAMVNACPVSASPVDGTVFGTVLECNPGTVLSTPGKPLPTPTPTVVILVRGDSTFSSYFVRFGSRSPWVGSFTFRAPAGRYEVISALPGYQVSWVTVVSGTKRTVVFRHYACPV
jgi:hypothetical protein